MRHPSPGARLILFGLWTVMFSSPGGGSQEADALDPLHRDLPAWAMPDCAPFDGPATLIHVTPRVTPAAEPFSPTVSISIGRPIDRARGRRYTIAPAESWGAVTLCRDVGQCITAVAGEVRLDTGRAGEPIVGWYDLRFPDGSRQHGSFHADLRERLSYCG